MSQGAHHPAAVSPVEQRVAALEALLTERGLVPEGFIEEITRRYESEIGPMNGAKVVARAWTDPEYKERLLADGTAAIAELARPKLLGGGTLLAALTWAFASSKVMSSGYMSDQRKLPSW